MVHSKAFRKTKTQRICLIILCISDTDLLTNFIFNASNQKAFVTRNTFTFNFARTNTFSNFIGFISQAAAAGKIEIIFCPRQWPSLFSSVNINNRSWPPEFRYLNVTSSKQYEQYHSNIAENQKCSIFNI